MISNERIGELSRAGYYVKHVPEQVKTPWYAYIPSGVYIRTCETWEAAWEAADAHARQQREGADLAKRRKELERCGYGFVWRDGYIHIDLCGTPVNFFLAELSAIIAAEKHWESVWPRAWKEKENRYWVYNNDDKGYFRDLGGWIVCNWPASTIDKATVTTRLPHADAVRLLAEATGAVEKPAPVQPDPWAGAVECVFADDPKGKPMLIEVRATQILGDNRRIIVGNWGDTQYSINKNACLPCPARPTVAPPEGMEIVAWRMPKPGEFYFFTDNPAWLKCYAIPNDRRWIAAPVAKAEVKADHWKDVEQLADTGQVHYFVPKKALAKALLELQSAVKELREAKR